LTISGPTDGEVQLPVALAVTFDCRTVELDVPVTRLVILVTVAGSISGFVSRFWFGIADAVPLACQPWLALASP